MVGADVCTNHNRKTFEGDVPLPLNQKENFVTPSLAPFLDRAAVATPYLCMHRTALRDACCLGHTLRPRL